MHLKKDKFLYLIIGILVGIELSILFGIKYQIFEINLSKIDWVAVSAIVLAVTVIFLYKQTKATENLAKYQLVPAIEVNMIYDKNAEKTYFWFSNASSIPGLVTLKIKTLTREYSIGPLRIPPKELGRRTASDYDFFDGSKIDEYKVCLHAIIKPDVSNCNFERIFLKDYIFRHLRWDEYTWGYPDPFFPLKNNSKIKPQGFTHDEWLQEKKLQSPVMIVLPTGEGIQFGWTLPCPKCDRVGFYVSADSPAVPEYRMCKYCGFWQKVDGPEEYCKMFYHKNCPMAQGESIIFREALKYSWLSGEGNKCECQRCKETISNVVDWPIKDKNHPFNQLIKEGNLIILATPNRF